MAKRILYTLVVLLVIILVITFSARSSGGLSVAEVRRIGIQRLVLAERMYWLPALSQSGNIETFSVQDAGETNRLTFSANGYLVSSSPSLRNYEFRPLTAGKGFEVWRYRKTDKTDEERVDLCIETHADHDNLEYECTQERRGKIRTNYLKYTASTGRLLARQGDHLSELYFNHDGQMIGLYRNVDEGAKGTVVEGQYRQIKYGDEHITTKRYARYIQGSWVNRQYLWLAVQFEWGDEWEEAKQAFEPYEVDVIAIDQRNAQGLITKMQAEGSKGLMKFDYTYHVQP